MDLSIHDVSVDRLSLKLARLSAGRRPPAAGRRRSRLTAKQARALAREPFIEEYEADDLISHLTGFNSVGRPAVEALTGAAPLELCMRPRWGIAPGAGGFSTASLALSLLRLAELGVPCDPAPVVLAVKERIKKQMLLTKHETHVTFFRPCNRIPPVVAFTWPADAHDHDLPPGD